MKKKALLIFFVICIKLSWLALPCGATTALTGLANTDIVMVAGTSGQVVMEKNTATPFVPASILKIFTALTAFHHLGPHYRFETPFCWDEKGNLMVQGQGDPLLISEAWDEIAHTLAQRLNQVRTIVLDDSYFQRGIHIPGSGQTTNPYDAPLGALCANFNTVFFKQDDSGKIISAEPQTPITSLARRRITALNVKKGRYTFSHRHDDIVRYAGELLAYFIKKNGVAFNGEIVSGLAHCSEASRYVYASRFTLEEAVQKMLEFSNNFLANQLIVALGAHVYGPPGTLAKGVKVMRTFAESELGLDHITIVEGSGISRKNRMSAKDMMIVLKAFAPYRHLLAHDGAFRYKTGTLSGIRTRAGYIHCPGERTYAFVIAVKSRSQMEMVLAAIKAHVPCQPLSRKIP